MTNSYVSVSVKLARKGWRHFDLDVTDGTIGTESELTEVESGKTLGAEVGDVPDTILDIQANGENYFRYMRFNQDTIGKITLPGPQAVLIGPAGTELTAGGATRYTPGVDFTPFVVNSSWSLTANTSADGTGA